MILPFLILCFYNQPTPEDFVFGNETNKLGFLKAQEFFYNNWSGRFFSYAVLSLNSLIFTFTEGYKITTILFMLLFISIFVLLFSAFFKREINFSEILILSLSVLFLYFYKAPSISEGFYWLTSTVIYHLGFILICIFLISYQKVMTENRKQKTENTICCCMLNNNNRDIRFE